MLNRRTEMLSLRAKGTDLKDIINEISIKYKVKEKTLYSDWENRGLWAPQILQLNDKNIFFEVFRGYWEVLREAWLRYYNSSNESVRIASLKLVKDTYRDMLEVLQNLCSLKPGLVRNEDRIDADVGHIQKVIENMTPEQLKKIVEVLNPFNKGRQDDD